MARRPLGPGAAVSLLAHAAVIALLVIRSRALLGGGAPAGPGGAHPGGEDGRPSLNFFALPAAPAPAEIVLPAPPRVTLTALPPVESIPLDLPRVELPRATPAVAGPSVASVGTGGGATGAGGAPGTGSGAGTGVGPGTRGGDGYIFVASPRTAILPPLAQVPGSVRGRIYHVTFWVSAEGQVARVEVDPPIADAAYGRAFHAAMMAYQFYPAHTRDGRPVEGIVTYSVQVGN